MTREQRLHEYRGGAEIDPAMKLHGAEDVVAKAIEAGAKYRTDPVTGKVTVITTDGAARFAGDAEYSYTQQRGAWVKLALIGLALVPILIAIASCGA
jgi:hypothetical protein